MNVIIPRPGPNGEPVPGIGKVCRDDGVLVFGLFGFVQIISYWITRCGPLSHLFELSIDLPSGIFGVF